jgi:hypothetical protein
LWWQLPEVQYEKKSAQILILNCCFQIAIISKMRKERNSTILKTRYDLLT